MTKEQKENLKKLLDLKIPKNCQFAMSDYFYNGQGYKLNWGFRITKDSYECGTTACFAGYLPYVTGIAKKKKELWPEYIFRVTGIKKCSDKFDYLFGYGWDDDLKEAKIRLKDFINNGYKTF